MSWLSSLFGGGKSNPANAAMPYLNKIPGVGEKYYNPYIEQGQQAGGMLSEQFQKLMSDPTGFINQLQSQYKPSEGYQFKRGELEKGLGAAAAAGGLAGTPYHQQEYGQMADKLLSEDMQQYLQNALGVYGTGLQGEQDFYNKGFQASGSLADMLAGNLNQQGGLAFQGSAFNKQQQNQLIQALMQALGGAGGFASNPLSLFGNKIW